MGDVPQEDLKSWFDGAIRGKEVASTFFQSLAGSVGELELRRSFRRLGQEEWDHRKILMKHRRELFGRPEPGRVPPADPSCPFAPLARKAAIRGSDDLKLAIRAAIQAEQQAHRGFEKASRSIDDRAVKVFLRILAEEGLAQADALRETLALVDEADRRGSPLAAVAG
jgi:rubrerythrin